MMNIRIFVIRTISLLALVALTACIKDEMPNIEVDVLSVTSPQGGVLNTVIQEGHIEVYAAPGADPANFPLQIAVSHGATIAPDPATVNDYSQPRLFDVTSQDGNWCRQYIVTVRQSSLPTTFDFEHWMQPERMRYMIPYELSGSTQMMVWACGNPAYNFLTGKNDDYTAFPTQPTTDACSGQYAAKLVTRLTGQVDRPIAAGSLFIGQFDGSKFEPRESTMFGLPFIGKPVMIKGMYRYRSGGVTLKSQTPDCASIRAVLYRTDLGETHLNGFTIKNSPSIVARAEFDSPVTDTPGDGYVPFAITFVYTSAIDDALMSRGLYNLAINFTSSRDGDVYDGAEGSTLYIDNVQIICEP